MPGSVYLGVLNYLLNYEGVALSDNQITWDPLINVDFLNKGL